MLYRKVNLFLFPFVELLMWKLKESSNYCGFTWGIVIQWPCRYLNQKCSREWRNHHVIYVNTAGTNGTKLIQSSDLLARLRVAKLGGARMLHLCAPHGPMLSWMSRHLKFAAILMLKFWDEAEVSLQGLLIPLTWKPSPAECMPNEKEEANRI